MNELLGFFTNHLGPLPVWAWVAVVGGGIVLAVVLRRRFGNQSSAATDAGSTGTGVANSALDPNIDPNTGVPYSVEEATNPNTGLPAYYGGAGITTQNAPQGQAQLAQLAAALQQIQNGTNTQQNPTGAGGLASGGTGTVNTLPAVVNTSEQNHAPVLSGDGGNASTPNYTQPVTKTPVPITTTVFTGIPETGGRTAGPTAIRGTNRYQ